MIIKGAAKNMKHIRIIFIFLFFSLAFTFNCKKDPSSVTTVQHIEDITVEQAKTLVDSDKEVKILDVRTSAEYSDSHIPNAFNIDFYSDSFSTDVDSLDHNAKYLIYCRSGNRSKSATNIMETKGFKTLYNMLGGFDDWKAKGYPVTH